MDNSLMGAKISQDFNIVSTFRKYFLSRQACISEEWPKMFIFFVINLSDIFGCFRRQVFHNLSSF